MTNAVEKNFSGEEIQIAKRICGSLKKKRLYFETLSNNTHSFLTAYSIKNCNTNSFLPERLIKVTLDNSNPIDMEYISTEVDFNIKHVLTDQSLFVKNLCDDLEKNSQKVSNTIRSNLVAYTFTVKTVTKGQVYDRLEILKRVPATIGNGLVVQSGEVSELYTRPGQTEDKFMGVEFFKERHSTCSNSNSVSIYRESFTKPLTSF